MKKLLHLIFLCLCFSAAAFSLEEPTYESPSSWITPIDFFAEREPGKYQGEIYLLKDIQYNHPLKETYTHIVKKFLSKSSIEEGSTLEISFSPSYQTLTLHQIHVYRQGQVLDKLETSKKKVAQLETESSDLIYDDESTLICFLDDIRPGDILEYSFTLSGNLPQLSDQMQALFYLGGSTFTQKYYNRLVVDKDFPFQWIKHNTDVEPKVSDLDRSLQEWVWEANNVKPTWIEYNLPSWYNPFPWIQVSSFPSWGQVAEVCRESFELPSDYCREILEIIAFWQEMHLNKEDQILEAIRFVQNEIRYLSLHEGVEAFQPHDPNQVFLQRYGDCKDKTLLLIALLQLLDVPAYPACINTYLGETLQEMLPSIFFDHVIVSFEFQGKSYFVDPTFFSQGGELEELYLPPFSYTLVLNENCRDLTAIPFPEDAGKIKREVKYWIHLKENHAKMESKWTYTGHCADSRRRSLEDISQEEFAEATMRFYEQYHETIEPLSNPIVEDRIEENILTLNSSFLIEDMGYEDLQSDLLSYDIEPLFIFNFLPDDLNPSRKMPFGIIYPFHFEEVIHLEIEDDADEYFSSDEEENFEYKNDSFEFYLSKVRLSRNELRFTVQMKTWKDSIDAQQIRELQRELKKLYPKLDLSFDFTRKG